MIRPILLEIALFLTPFAIYAAFLWLTRAGVLHPESWPLPRLIWLTIASLLLMLSSFVVIAQIAGTNPRSTYTPAHLEGGQLVPGATK